jgi:PIN domain
MVNLFIDTCVWLDVAKDHQQQATLGVLEQLVKRGAVKLIIPTIIRNEFARNKARIIQESQRSVSSVLKRAKEIVHQLEDPKRKRAVVAVLAHLNEVDYKLPSMGEAVAASIGRVEKLFAASPVIEISDAAKLRAAERALTKKAPFHRDRNSMADALLIETYGELVAAKEPGIRLGFVTHNTKDFSHPNADNREPHPDLAAYFSKIKSRYFIKLSEALKRVEPALVSDLMLAQEWPDQEPRTLTEILDAIDLLMHQVWYNRYQVRREKIEAGEIKIVEKETYPLKYPEQTMGRDTWEGAKKSARRVEKKYGIENLGPWDDFEWGMINGKLSALRWVLGEDWDELYT